MRSSSLVLVLFLLLVFALGAALFSRGPSPQFQAGWEAQRLQTQAKTDAIKVACLSGLAIATVFAALALVAGLVRAVWRQPQLIRPNGSGIFPLVRGHAGRHVFFHDPNRQVAGTAVYHSDPEGLDMQQLFPDGMEAEQLQVTTQAQAVQLVASASQSPPSSTTRRLVQRISRRHRSVPRMPEIQLLSPEVPEERRLLTAICRDWEGEHHNGHLASDQETL